MTRRRQSGRSWPAVVAAAAVFALLGTLPITLSLLHVHLAPVAATTSHGVTLLPAPNRPAPVPLPRVAQPIDPTQPPAGLPSVDSAREAAAVSAEDHRIRTMLHDAVRIYQPEVIPVRGSLPTLVLTATSHAYTAPDLVQYGALVMLANNSALLLDNLFVSTNARLSLGGSALHVLYLDSGSGGFASIVGWGGSLSFHGTSRQPMTIMGWDRADSSPATDKGDGRPYIREVDGSMTFSNVRVSALGFWSGRTGGVAWTGVTGKPSTGGATDSTFTDDTYGAFLSRTSDVTFKADLFEFNELDGLRIHRYSVGTTVASSSSSRNGGNGFIVSRATRNTVLTGDVSQNNTENGYYIDGRPLVSGASASGGSATPGSGAVVEDSAAIGNGRIGILIEGGDNTVVKADQVCAAVTAIAVRYNAADAVLTGNDIRCSPRTGFSIGPAAPDTTISGNAVSGARMGILVRDSGAVELDNNRITGATVFGITARGLPSKVSGVGNVLSGTGFRAVDARADAGVPALSGTDMSGWAHHAKVTFWSYLWFHPLAALWLSIAILVLLGALWSHRRHLPSHPYPHSTRWRSSLLAGPAGPQRAATPATSAIPATPARSVTPALATARTATAAAPPAYEHALTSESADRRRAPSETAVRADFTAPMPVLSGAASASAPSGVHASSRMVPPWAPEPEPSRAEDFDVFSPRSKKAGDRP